MNANHEHAWEDPRSEFEEKPTAPAYDNACGHNPADFVGQIAYWQGKDRKVADVYVFTQWQMQSVCIRCSNEGGDYISPGTVLDLLISAHRHEAGSAYKAAAALIDEAFKVKFERVK